MAGDERAEQVMLYFDARPTTFGQDLTAIMQRAAFADNVLMTIAEEMEKVGGLLAFPDIDPKNPEGVTDYAGKRNAFEWFEIERIFFINERKAIEAAILATNPGMKAAELRTVLKSRNAWPALPPEVRVDPIPVALLAERTENLLKFYDEFALKTKPRGKTGLPLIIGGIAVGLFALGALTYFTRKK